VRTHDFVEKELGRAVPYGVYDLANDEGWVSVGNRADTAEFAVETVRRWWREMGRSRFPEATPKYYPYQPRRPTLITLGQ
jgi:alkanesulfonate monooxygenase SsuD/methylene tetrahydromethanopterin reductase-like flavin-dependent oxidoreductase (luciferase family)